MSRARNAWFPLNPACGAVLALALVLAFATTMFVGVTRNPSADALLTRLRGAPPISGGSMAVSAGLREPVTTFSPTDQVVGSRAPETHAATISILPLEMAYDPVARYIAAEGAESCTDGPQLTVSRGTPVLTARPRALPMSRFLAAEGGAEGQSILEQAAQGQGNFGLGSADATQANELGNDWVGDNARLSSKDKALVSQDGLRQFRFPSLKPSWGNYQANFESRLTPSGPWTSNGHLTITFGPPAP